MSSIVVIVLVVVLVAAVGYAIYDRSQCMKKIKNAQSSGVSKSNCICNTSWQFWRFGVKDAAKKAGFDSDSQLCGASGLSSSPVTVTSFRSFRNVPSFSAPPPPKPQVRMYYEAPGHSTMVRSPLFNAVPQSARSP